MIVACQYLLGEEPNVLDLCIVPPAVCSVDDALAQAKLTWAAILLATLLQLVLQRRLPTQQRPSRKIPGREVFDSFAVTECDRAHVSCKYRES